MSWQSAPQCHSNMRTTVGPTPQAPDEDRMSKHTAEHRVGTGVS